MKNTQDAQDVCQTVFVRLLTEPREFESGEHERAYILRMAANACKDLLKSPWRRRTCDLEACAQVPAPETSDGSVLAAVNQLPAHYRSVISVSYTHLDVYKRQVLGNGQGVPGAAGGVKAMDIVDVFSVPEIAEDGVLA